MGSSRECAFTGLRHPSCRACSGFITRRSDHVHIYGRKADPDESLCGDCWAVYAVASLPILRAAERLGVDPNPGALLKALQEGHIQVVEQSVLTLCLN